MPINLPNYYQPIPQFPTEPQGLQAGLLGIVGGLNKGVDAYKAMKNFQEDLQAKRLQNELSQWNIKEKQELFPTLKPKALADIEETKARSGLYGEQAKEKAWHRMLGYPTDEILTFLQYGNLPKIQTQYGGATAPTAGQPAPTYPAYPTEGASSTAPVGAGATPSITGGQTLTQKAISDALSKYQENQQLDSEIYFGKPPSLTQIPGLTAEQQRYFQDKHPDPTLKYKQDLSQEEIKREADRYKETYKETAPAARAATKILPDEDTLLNIYDEIETGKGVGFGSMWALSSQAQTYDRILQGMMNKLAAGLAGGRNVTQADFQAVLGAKEPRSLNEDAKIRVANISRAADLADIDQDAFFKMAEAKHITNNMAQRAYNAYAKHRPYQNQNQGQLYNNNAFIGTGADFLTPEALRSIARTGDYVPKNQKTLERQNITNNDMSKFRVALQKLDKNVSKINVMNVLKNPDLISDKEFVKIRKDIPTNILLQWRKNKVARGGD